MPRQPCCDKTRVKKGPWSPEEDAQLKNFMQANGNGSNWITLPSKAGLRRCGKSCRLRWINYLRPDIRHGSFTDEEEKLIVHLHQTVGSKWSLIAKQLRGRTDNDVKNYWNTRLKKKVAAQRCPGLQMDGLAQPAIRRSPISECSWIMPELEFSRHSQQPPNLIYGDNVVSQKAFEQQYVPRVPSDIQYERWKEQQQHMKQLLPVKCEFDVHDEMLDNTERAREIQSELQDMIAPSPGPHLASAMSTWSGHGMHQPSPNSPCSDFSDISNSSSYEEPPLLIDFQPDVELIWNSMSLAGQQSDYEIGRQPPGYDTAIGVFDSPLPCGNLSY